MTRPTAAAGWLLAVLMLSGCTSTQSALDPTALVPPEPDDTTNTEPRAITPSQPDTAASARNEGQNEAQAQVAAIDTDARVEFVPVIGATADAVPVLSQRLTSRARERGITLAGGGNSSATHVMKGYFSAISEGAETTVIFVWDVLDPSGNRLHRIQGQQTAPGGGGDGWSSVTETTMETIAVRTIDDLAAWLASGES